MEVDDADVTKKIEELEAKHQCELQRYQHKNETLHESVENLRKSCENMEVRASKEKAKLDESYDLAVAELQEPYNKQESYMKQAFRDAVFAKKNELDKEHTRKENELKMKYSKMDKKYGTALVHLSNNFNEKEALMKESYLNNLADKKKKLDEEFYRKEEDLKRKVM